MASSAPPIAIENVSHFYGKGELRKQILFDVSTEIRAGEIVIVTGPSGSGKTTLLTLIGALRSAQQGSLRVLGRELRGADARSLEAVRRRVGYIFQSHNLIDALTAVQNVSMSVLLDPAVSRAQAQARAREMLEAVGLGDRAGQRPSQMSGGQRQRVAIARALAGRPEIILADEPTASLDKQSGREVVDRIHDLARNQGVTVLLVTHDNRILDVADRIIHLEDGRLSSFTDAVLSETRHIMGLLATSHRKGDLADQVASLSDTEFVELLENITAEARRFQEGIALANDDAFQSMLEQALGAFTHKAGEILGAERASLFLVDEARGELWLKVARDESGRALDTRVPLDAGIAGLVASRGESIRIDDAYAHPRFNPQVDRDSGFRTRSILCVPLRDSREHVFAVAQLLNRRDGQPFDAADEQRFSEFVGSIGVLLEAWWTMNRGHESRAS